jgi:hypothetical protein
MTFSTNVKDKIPETSDYVEALNHQSLCEVLWNVVWMLFALLLGKYELCCCFKFLYTVQG